jgi:hypothetical protein
MNNKDIIRHRAKSHIVTKYGEGIFQNMFHSVKHVVNNAVNTVKQTATTIEHGAVDAFHKVEHGVNNLINGRNEYSPSSKAALDRAGNEMIQSITIGRTPVPSAITSILKTVSSTPYDTLFHLFITITTTQGTKVKIEKNAQINIQLNPPNLPDTEILSVPAPSITVNGLLQKTQSLMGNKYFNYSGYSNNCQHYILAIFNANGISTGLSFIKQNTDSIFREHPNLRKFANTVTDIAGRSDVLFQGGKISKRRSKR